MSLSERIKKALVMDVEAACSDVIRFILNRPMESFMAGAARIVEKGERAGRTVIYYESGRRNRYRVEVSLEHQGGTIVFKLRGDLNGEVRVVSVERGKVCRLYLVSELEGQMTEEYGDETGLRILRRLALLLSTAYNVRLPPSSSAMRPGDMYSHMLELLNLLVEGVSSTSSIVIDLSKRRVVDVEGLLPEADVNNLIPPIYSLVDSAMQIARVFNAGKARKIIVELEGSVVLVDVREPVAVVSLAGWEAGEEES